MRTVLICGRGRMAVDGLAHAAALHAAGVAPVRLLACPSGGDAGVDTWQPSLVAAARALDVPLVEVDSLRGDPDLLLVSLEYDRIIDVARFASPSLYNVHFSALPAYRGVYTSIWPILNGEEEAGVTLHRIDAGVDTGAVVAQARFPLGARTTARELFDRFHAEGTGLFVEGYASLVAGPVAATPQDEAGASLYRRADLAIDQARVLSLDMTAEALDRRARAFYFPEYQTATFEGRGVRACRPLRGGADASSAPGILAETERGAVARAADGRLVELVWAPSGAAS